MLISYALLIFTLSSSVVAPTPPPVHQSQGDPSVWQPVWKRLEGSKDPCLINPSPWPNLAYRWYKLKPMKTKTDYPTWSENKDLDQVIQFIRVTDGGGVEQVSIFEIYRQIHQGHGIDQYKYHRTRLISKKVISLDADNQIDLEGFWGRGVELENVSQIIFENLDCVSRSSLQNYLMKPQIPVVAHDMVIRIEKPSGRWKWHFDVVDWTWINRHTPGFMSALTWYWLSQEEAKYLSPKKGRPKKIKDIPADGTGPPALRRLAPKPSDIRYSPYPAIMPVRPKNSPRKTGT